MKNSSSHEINHTSVSSQLTIGSAPTPHKEYSFNNLYAAPLLIKLCSILGTILILSIALYFIWINEKISALHQQQRQFQQLQQEYLASYQRSQQVTLLQQQVDKLEKIYTIQPTLRSYNSPISLTEELAKLSTLFNLQLNSIKQNKIINNSLNLPTIELIAHSEFTALIKLLNFLNTQHKFFNLQSIERIEKDKFKWVINVYINQEMH